MSEKWTTTKEALREAVAITWDTCHKIYVLMDEGQVEEMRGYGYDPILRVDDPAEALETVKDWYRDSCALRFVSGIRTVDGDPNEGFTRLIPQF